MKEVWLRLGVVLQVTDAEAEALMGPRSEDTMRRTIERVLANGRWVPSGDTYIPSDSVDAFNEEYGTEFESEDYYTDM